MTDPKDIEMSASSDSSESESNENQLIIQLKIDDVSQKNRIPQ